MQAENRRRTVQNRWNESVRDPGQGEVEHGKYKRFKLGGPQPYDFQSD